MEKYIVAIRAMLVMVVSFFCMVVTAQISYPQIGKPLPNFYFNVVEHYKEKTITASSLRGKHVIIEFWTRYCSNCVAGFQHLNSLQAKYKDNLQFLLVGYADTKMGESAKIMYEKFRAKYNLQLPVVYDSAVFTDFGISSVPHTLWIDPMGVVQAITYSQHVTASNIDKFIMNEKLALEYKPNDFENTAEVSPAPTAIVNATDKNNALINSVLSGYTPKTSSVSYINNNKALGFYTDEEIKLVNVPLDIVYLCAYGDTIPSYTPSEPHYGLWSSKAVLAMKDTSQFISDRKKGINLFSYQLSVKQGTSKLAMQTIMQTVLAAQFGYEVQIEKRLMPCWILTAEKEVAAKYKTAGKQSYNESNFGRIYFRNMPTSFLIRLIWGQHPNQLPIIDRTGIEHAIDLDFNVILTDFEDVRQRLADLGFRLKKDLAPMQVLVIKDKEEKLITTNQKRSW